MANNKLRIFPWHRCRNCGEWAQAILPPVDDLCGRCEVMRGKYPSRHFKRRGDGMLSRGTTARINARRQAAKIHSDLAR